MSLGWLSEPSILPRKAKLIDNVDQHSLLGLQSVLFQAEAEFKHAGGGATIRSKARKRPPKDIDRLGKKNTGVDERNKRDALNSQSEADTAVYALKRKAEIYESLRQGQIKPSASSNSFLIDFERKEYETGGDEQRERLALTTHGNSIGSKQLNMRKEREAWEAKARADIEQLENPTVNREYFGGTKQNVWSRTQEEKDDLLQMSNDTLSARQARKDEKNKIKNSKLNRLQLLKQKSRRKKMRGQNNLELETQAGGQIGNDKKEKKEEISLSISQNQPNTVLSTSSVIPPSIIPSITTQSNKSNTIQPSSSSGLIPDDTGRDKDRVDSNNSSSPRGADASRRKRKTRERQGQDKPEEEQETGKDVNLFERDYEKVAPPTCLLTNTVILKENETLSEATQHQTLNKSDHNQNSSKKYKPNAHNNNHHNHHNELNSPSDYFNNPNNQTQQPYMDHSTPFPSNSNHNPQNLPNSDYMYNPYQYQHQYATAYYSQMSQYAQPAQLYQYHQSQNPYFPPQGPPHMPPPHPPHPHYIQTPVPHQPVGPPGQPSGQPLTPNQSTSNQSNLNQLQQRPNLYLTGSTNNPS